MTDAIVRHLTSGEHFLARLDDSGNAVQLSVALPLSERFADHSDETHFTDADWEHFSDADLDPVEDEAGQWTADKFVVLHVFA